MSFPGEPPSRSPDPASEPTASAGAPTGDGPFSGYSPDRPSPLGEYALLSGVFNAGLIAVLAAGRDRLPERFGAGDIALMGMATHKFTRLISKDKVTAFARAPFVRYEGDAGPAEVSEAPRGSGLRRTIGELLACPYCLGLWVSSGYGAGLLFAPRHTRFLGSVLAGLTISDFLQLAYKAGQGEA